MVLVSAIIPVFNQERYLAEAIESVLAQTFRDFELIVVDDGSTDRTPEVIASYAPRVRAIRKPNGGNASALNAGIREARGAWIGWLSSDDLWEPTKLARQLAAARDASSIGLVYTDVLLIDPKGKVLERQHLPCPAESRRRLVALARHCFINGSSALVRREVFDAVGVFDEADRMTSDFDLWLRIAERFEIVHVPDALVRYRVHPAQLSRKRGEMERLRKRVASRAVRRMGPVLGIEVAGLRLADEVREMPWRVRAGGYDARGRVAALFDSLRILVNPAAP